MEGGRNEDGRDGGDGKGREGKVRVEGPLLWILNKPCVIRNN